MKLDKSRHRNFLSLEGKFLNEFIRKVESFLLHLTCRSGLIIDHKIIFHSFICFIAILLMENHTGSPVATNLGV